jgi:hypothetical protein
MTVAWLSERRDELADAVAGRLAGKPGSAYAAVGPAACREHAVAAVAALQADLPRGKTDALRPVVRALVESLAPHGLGFADLRAFVHALRGAVLGALEAATPAAAERPAVDAWFLELGLVCANNFVVVREAAAQQRAAEAEIRHRRRSSASSRRRSSRSPGCSSACARRRPRSPRSSRGSSSSR